ncbi:aminotransferase class I/II-fold pyridoxal phosphate-dependent enzyme [Zhongshania arctica]|uniref:Aminotransferase n=1 Tax=Zhongshania arctica TaxID=3238302 RepID=A0ABV3TWK4_9GAMM
MMDASQGVPKHGGDPRHIPAADAGVLMLDLATGVNPWGWPVPAPPIACYSKLPYFNEGLQRVAATYYGVPQECLLATAGSQAVIQQLPFLAASGRVLLSAVGYEEHRYRWELAGHDVVEFHRYDRDAIAKQIRRDAVQHLVLISPNNPSADQLDVDDLRYWRSLLPEEGMLVVDQAFADANPESDVSALAGDRGIVLLRSVGKFFGLPGLRLGFVIAAPALLAELDKHLGPWAVSGVAQWLGERALADQAWQQKMVAKLADASEAQAELLVATFKDYGVRCVATALFVTLIMPLQRAEVLQMACYRAGLSVRLYRCGDTGFIRWGLAADINELRLRLRQLNLSSLVA